MALVRKVKITKNFIPIERSCHKGRDISEELPLIIQKLWQGLIFLNIGRRSNILGPMERFCHVEYTCEIWKLYLLALRSYKQG